MSKAKKATVKPVEEIKSTVETVETEAEVKPEQTKKSITALSNEDLLVELYKRKIAPVRGDDGHLIRQIAYMQIKEHDANVLPEDTATGKKYRKMVVKFNRNGASTSTAPYVAITHNGVNYFCPYEKEVSLPEYVIKGPVDDAIETRVQFTGDFRKDGSYIYNYSNNNVLNYTFVRWDDEEDKNANPIEGALE